jgi:hypothetical protein
MDLFGMEIDWAEAGMGTYSALSPNGGGKKEFVLLHESCFSQLLDELAKQELSTIVAFTVGTISDLRDAMGM